MKENSEYEFKYIVKKEDLASLLPLEKDDAFPCVLATYRMIALMEMSAARLMRPLLKDGELSVGVNVNVTHTAPTLEADEITIKAKFLHMDGKLYKFKVEIYDIGGLAGSGTHSRAVVNNEKLMIGANKRASK